MYRVGIDVGSTTIKTVVLNTSSNIIHSSYKRHRSSVSTALNALIDELFLVCGDEPISLNFTGSAALSIAKRAKVSFVQEVISASTALKHDFEGFDVCVELGGEDAKIMFFDGVNIEQRMNGSCAGGTGAFIDQMASLLNTDAAGLNQMAAHATRLYDIASRCGVFAKTDIQPLINQGAKKEDIALSIYQAIVNQTIGGLSQGKKIQGRVVFLGGPLTFSDMLRQRFIDVLDLKNAETSPYGEVFMAYGAALKESTQRLTLETLKSKLEEASKQIDQDVRRRLKPLFASAEEKAQFLRRHAENKVPKVALSDYQGPIYIGVDAGSTTSKVVAISQEKTLLFDYYTSNQGNPVERIKEALEQFYQEKQAKAYVAGAYATGYGEALMQAAFSLDGGEVETICHYEAAKYFDPRVEFVIDIGGQDMKCFTVDQGVISSIVLNEACSSGCGSFIETFAHSLDHEIDQFASIALNAQAPVDLGSRCTVFMNSSVKQAQAESAQVADISAGLAFSVVKNALYKVIRAHNVKEEFGTHILVQGGTFKNDAVLRAFEIETGVEVIRPSIAPLMGAFGAALLALENSDGQDPSNMLTETQLTNFTYEQKHAVCRHCFNLCPLTINVFKEGKPYISGNRCERGAGVKAPENPLPNLYLQKYEWLIEEPVKTKAYDLKVGIPLALNMFENLPFWRAFFDELSIEVVVSGRSSKKLYEYGQDSIPSDTVCYPAKLVHGHIESLLMKDVDFIFYPNMPFHPLEKDHGDNHYNCPIVAHYPEVIEANLDDIAKQPFLKPYVTLSDRNRFVKTMQLTLEPFVKIPKKQLIHAYDEGIKAYQAYQQKVQDAGDAAIDYAIQHDLNIMVLAGRPYHIDPEINHSIPKLLRSLNTVVLSEDAIAHRASAENLHVLNQWTYHTRLYDAAIATTQLPKAEYVQLVSFGCGLDAITADEIKDLLQQHHKLYTQIKIDEISNLGAVNIRLRSLLATMNREAPHD